MSEWMTIRVELTGRRGAPLRPAPGRILLAHPDHVFAELADAVDSAFGRWDITPLHEFTVDGRRVLPGGDPDDEGAADSDTLTLGEASLGRGARFTYVFDPGEGWEHECRVEEVDVEAAPELDTDVPIPVFGWGSIPDQYGRVTDDDDGPDDETEADETFDPSADDETFDPADALDTDDIDFGVVETAVPTWRTPAPVDALTAAASRLRTESQLGLPPFDSLLDAAGYQTDSLPPDDEALWTEVAAAAIQPVAVTSGDPAAEAVWATMEAADWAGLVIGLVRGDVGQSAEPEVLAHLIESCPDIETEPLFGEDREAVIEALDIVVSWWQALDAVDEDRRLTELGRWGLPLALEAAWA